MKRINLWTKIHNVGKARHKVEVPLAFLGRNLDIINKEVLWQHINFIDWPKKNVNGILLLYSNKISKDKVEDFAIKLMEDIEKDREG